MGLLLGKREMSYADALSPASRNSIIRYGLNIALAIIAITVEVYYSFCGGACASLSGKLFGIGLQYIGIGYMVFIIVLNIAKKDHLIAVVLTAGVAVELYLIGFQIVYDTYCPYCIVFGAIIISMFLYNLRRAYLKTSLVLAIFVLALFCIFFKGTAIPQFTVNTFHFLVG